MVQINIGTGQGITQAIRDKIGATNIKNSDLGTWQKVVAEVNNAQAKDKSIFKSGENNTTDTTKLDDSSTYYSNFVVDEGNVEIDDGVWTRIKTLLTGKTETSVPAKETNPSNAPTQPENKNETSNGQTLVSKNNNAEILNKETFQTPKKYLSAGDLEQCKQMLHLEELPDGVSIAKENGQFLYFKDGKQISFQEVKNLTQKVPAQEAIVEPKNSENSEAKKPVENKKNEAKTVENNKGDSPLYDYTDTAVMSALYNMPANKALLGEYVQYLVSPDNPEAYSECGYNKKHVAGALNDIVLLKPSHAIVLNNNIRIVKNNDNSITVIDSNKDVNSNITYNADGTYRSGNVEEDGDFNTISKYVDRYLFSEMEDGFTFE